VPMRRSLYWVQRAQEALQESSRLTDSGAKSAMRELAHAYHHMAVRAERREEQNRRRAADARSVQSSDD